MRLSTGSWAPPHPHTHTEHRKYSSHVHNFPSMHSYTLHYWDCTHPVLQLLSFCTCTLLKSFFPYRPNENTGYLFILHYFNERLELSSNCRQQRCQCCVHVFFFYSTLGSFTCTGPIISKYTLRVRPLPCLFLILWYLRWLQSSGLQRYLMLIVHMKENLYEVWASGTDGASWGDPPVSSVSPDSLFPSF